MKAKNFLRYLALFAAFAASYAAFFYLYRLELQLDFAQAVAQVPSLRNFGSSAIDKVPSIAGTWGAVVGVGLGLISLLVSLVLLGLLKLTKLARFAWAHVIALLVAYGGWLIFGIELLYFENRFSAIAIGIIFFVGRPMYIAAIVTLVVLALLYLLPALLAALRHKKSSLPLVSLLLAAVVFLPGCDWISGIETLSCLISDDSAHCFQEAAVASGSAAACEKIKVSEDFVGLGSNPPKDKCYLMVAQNTGDLSACDKIQGGPMSYTREECITAVAVEHDDLSACGKLTGDSKQSCLSLLGPKITPDKVLEVDDQIKLLKDELAKNPDAALQTQLAGLEAMRNDMLGVMSKDNLDQYERQSDPLNQEIIGDWAVGDIDSETKNDLIQLNKNLREQGVTLTKEQYEQMKDILKRRNDPANDIEQMSDSDIVKDRFGEKVGGFVNKLKFWKTNDTSTEKLLDQQLRFYARMLERQQAIEQGLSQAEQDLERATNAIFAAGGDAIADEVKDQIIEELFGSAAGAATKVTTAVLGEALKEVQSAAKAAEFRGLVRIYNQAMEEELAKAGGNVDQAHAAVVKKLSDNPDEYSYEHTFAQSTNLLKNKDCDGSNPHCLNKDVFWKAMKKSYNYQNPGK
ncbi:MAG: hypothetical protein V1738_00260 [Patescibacteria group bacterium]